MVCLLVRPVCFFVSIKRQNDQANWAHIFCGVPETNAVFSLLFIFTLFYRAHLLFQLLIVAFSVSIFSLYRIKFFFKFVDFKIFFVHFLNFTKIKNLYIE